MTTHKQAVIPQMLQATSYIASAGVAVAMWPVLLKNSMQIAVNEIDRAIPFFFFAVPASALFAAIVGMAIYALSCVEEPEKLPRTAARTFRMMCNIATLSALVSCGGAASTLL